MFLFALPSCNTPDVPDYDGFQSTALYNDSDADIEVVFESATEVDCAVLKSAPGLLSQVRFDRRFTRTLPPRQAVRWIEDEDRDWSPGLYSVCLLQRLEFEGEIAWVFFDPTNLPYQDPDTIRSVPGLGPGSLVIQPGAEEVFSDLGGGLFADPEVLPPQACDTPSAPTWSFMPDGPVLVFEAEVLSVESLDGCDTVQFGLDRSVSFCDGPPVPFGPGAVLQLDVDDAKLELYEASTDTRFIHGIGRSTLETIVYAEEATGEICILDTPCGPALPGTVRVNVYGESAFGTWGDELSAQDDERSYTVWPDWTGRPLDSSCLEAVEATVFDRPLP